MERGKIKYLGEKRGKQIRRDGLVQIQYNIPSFLFGAFILLCLLAIHIIFICL